MHLAKLASGSGKSKETQVVEDDEVPVLINPDLPSLSTVIAAADVVIEVLDARDPASYRLAHIEEVVKASEGKKLLLVLNKIGALVTLGCRISSALICSFEDSCPKESVAAWATSLRAEYPTFLFRSASAFLASDAPPVPVPSKGKGKARADDALGLDTVIAALEKFTGEQESPLVIAVTGVTNVRMHFPPPLNLATDADNCLGWQEFIHQFNCAQDRGPHLQAQFFPGRAEYDYACTRSYPRDCRKARSSGRYTWGGVGSISKLVGCEQRSRSSCTGHPHSQQGSH